MPPKTNNALDLKQLLLMPYQYSVSVGRRLVSLPDVMVLLLLATAIYAIFMLGQGWRDEYRPAVEISLSLSALPGYALQSALRGLIAYALSLIFTLIVGYAAAKSKWGEMILIPALDILQSIPVLGFLPGLVLGLIAIFPNSNTGLELAAIIMIFTGQVWNMVFTYYASLKSIPRDYADVSQLIGLTPLQRLFKLELPFASLNLTWASLMSMSGGWFFLSICESFTLGSQQFRLPGIGSYMAVAIAAGDIPAMLAGIFAMASIIVFLDFVLWRPILNWVHRFRTEEIDSDQPTVPFMEVIIKESRLLRWLSVLLRRNRVWARLAWMNENILTRPPKLIFKFLQIPISKVLVKFVMWSVLGAIVLVSVLGAWKLVQLLWQIEWNIWLMLLQNTFITAFRVTVAVVLASVWTIPFGIWCGLSLKRVRVAQPIIQVLASFPAPMLYPLVLAFFFMLGINFHISSIFLLLMGVQWYILFSVLAGAIRIPLDLQTVSKHLQLSKWDRWTKLYLPSVFPAIITGWVTAAGGAWNASIVAEYFLYKGQVFSTHGLGASLSIAAENQNFPLLAGALVLMVLTVILVNRLLWAKLYELAHNRFNIESAI